ncbi:MAG TPA: hemolysin III family protein [Actinomycetota bacterium]
MASSKPRLRGRIHQVAFFVSFPAGASLIALADSPAARVVTAVYAASLTLLYGTSTLLHRLDWRPRVKTLMRKLDHSAIFLLIAGTYTAFAFLALQGTWRIAVLSIVWGGAAAGIVLKGISVERFQVVTAVLYIVTGWVGIVAIAVFLPLLGAFRAALLVAGGVLYTAGALVLLLRRPDPIPHVFGYHEIWHAMVVLASLCHYTVILLLVLG